MRRHDVVIVGAGLAGLRAAFEGITAGLDTAVLSKVHPLRSHSCAAQGGVNAAINADDNWEDHAYDTVKGADWVGDEDAIDLMCKEAPQAVLDMDEMGCPFSREDDGSIAQRAFGGASFPRTAFAADRTGHAMLHTLWEQAVKHGTHIYEEYHLLKVCVDEKTKRACGVIAMDIKSGQVEYIAAKAVLIATGGYGRLFASNTNAMINTGDGVALAMKAGAHAADLEFVQFHPTGLKSSGILISEGVRGEGAYLIGKDGKRFMEKYAPNKLELASRDVVSRAEMMEIMNGNGEDGAIFLDVRHLGREKILEKLPQIRQLSIDFEGVDPVDAPIPVKPTCHYTMGGIRTNKFGHSKLEGLFAAGEAACVSVHGGNRLGANSLLETIVFGKITGKEMVRFVNEEGSSEPETNTDDMVEVQKMIADLKARPKDGGVRRNEIHKLLTESLNENCSVFRDEDRLNKALDAVDKAKELYKKVYIDDKSEAFNTELLTTIELGNLIALGEATVRSALARTESRGAHTREEFPDRDDENWMKHTLAIWDNAKETVRLDYEATRVTGNPKYAPVERKY
ncbi:MAG: FAD-dependent oxidoreductase [Pseudomonadota bacterium]|nr:FAD-dependent oxidoreductase [Pseudomonadota bacterium]